MDGLARAVGLPLPRTSEMTHADADEWIARAEARHREVTSSRDEL